MSNVSIGGDIIAIAIINPSFRLLPVDLTEDGFIIIILVIIMVQRLLSVRGSVPVPSPVAVAASTALRSSRA
jgi:hypothetical protein